MESPPRFIINHSSSNHTNSNNNNNNSINDSKQSRHGTFHFHQMNSFFHKLHPKSHSSNNSQQRNDATLEDPLKINLEKSANTIVIKSSNNNSHHHKPTTLLYRLFHSSNSTNHHKHNNSNNSGINSSRSGSNSNSAHSSSDDDNDDERQSQFHPHSLSNQTHHQTVATANTSVNPLHPPTSTTTHPPHSLSPTTITILQNKSNDSSLVIENSNNNMLKGTKKTILWSDSEDSDSYFYSSSPITSTILMNINSCDNNNNLSNNNQNQQQHHHVSFLSRKSKSVKENFSQRKPSQSSRQKSHSNLIDFFKGHHHQIESNSSSASSSSDSITTATPSNSVNSNHHSNNSNDNNNLKKELPFLFRHLKPSKHVLKVNGSSIGAGLIKSEKNRHQQPLHLNNNNASVVSNTNSLSSSTLIDCNTSASTPISPSRNGSESSLCEKYGWIEKGCVGKGANGIVRVSHKQDPNCPSNEKLYAIKEFRKRNKNESEKSYIKKLTSEFCIGSSLHHENVIETVDLIQNDQHQWCEVMEYCAGGDLCNLIQHKHLTADEANTYFIQLIHGVAYIHSMGVAHRDLKPENLMLDAKGNLKITDFGEAEVFQSPYERSPHKSKRCCGSQPYMAPEEFIEKEFDPRPIDIFACGIIYLAMIYNRLPWKKPHMDDPGYRYYMQHMDSGFIMIDRLPQGPRQLIKQILNPDPNFRPTMNAIQEDQWFQQIEEWIVLQKKIKESNHGLSICGSSTSSLPSGSAVNHSSSNFLKV